MTSLPRRRIAAVEVSAIGLGCMTFNHAYSGFVPQDQARTVMLRALDLGVTHFDTAALYAFGVNEEWVGTALKPFRRRIFLASKCGMTGVDGKRVIDGRPQTLAKTCDEALARLQTDSIDLYYLHRLDRSVPIEDSVGALSRLVQAGKIHSIGLSEVSATTLRRAHAVHPIAAVQQEYSLWTRNAEIATLAACAELGAALVAFSPLGRGFLAGSLRGVDHLPKTDIRSSMPRFLEPHLSVNLHLVDRFEAIARDNGCTIAQLSLAWLLAQGPHVLPIPGTTSIAHLEEDLAAAKLKLPAAVIQQVGELINSGTVSGERYPGMPPEIDTEQVTTGTFLAAQR